MAIIKKINLNVLSSKPFYVVACTTHAQLALAHQQLACLNPLSKRWWYTEKCQNIRRRLNWTCRSSPCTLASERAIDLLTPLLGASQPSSISTLSAQTKAVTRSLSAAFLPAPP